MATENEPLLSQTSPSQPKKAASDPDAMTTARKATIMASLYFGVFLSAADGTLVTALLGLIASDLNSLGQIQWITTAYLVAYAATQPLYGKLSDIFGRRQMLLFANFSFGLGTLICGLSHSLGLLIFGRVVAGIGGGGMLSLSTIAISDFISLRQRGMFQGVGNIVYGSGASVGGFIGGIIAARYSWQTAFTCQVPLIVLSSLSIHTFLTTGKPAEGVVVTVRDEADLQAVRSHDVNHEHVLKKSSFARIDIHGSVTLVTAIVLLMVALSMAGVQYPWTSPNIYVPLSLSAVVLCLFCYIELRHAEEPVLPIPLLGDASILHSSLANLWMTMSVYGYIFLFPLFVSATQNLQPSTIGSKLIYNFLAVAAGSFGSGYAMKQTGRYYWIGIWGGIFYILGTTVMIFFYSPSMGDLVIGSSMGLCGFGYAVLLTVSLIALISAVPTELQAVVTSIQYTFRGVGSTVGVSIAASILQNSLAANLKKKVTGDDAARIIKETLSSVDVIWTLPEKQRLQVIDSYNSAAHAVIWFIAIFGLLAFGSMIFIKEYKLHNTVSRS